MHRVFALAATAFLVLSATLFAQVTLNVATVNNPDMVIMQQLTDKNFTKATGIKVNWTILPENQIRSKISEDVALGGGKFDLVTLGTPDIPVYVDNGWTIPLQPYFDRMTASEKTTYDYGDLIPAVMPAYSSATKGVAAIPFYAESTMLFYRKDLLAKKGLTMPENPTWGQIYNLAKQLNDPQNGVAGIALRGLPGYGENMYIFCTVLNAFGGRWFDANWEPQFDSPYVRAALNFYKKILIDAGEPGPTTYGYTECLNLIASGKAAMWYDATVSGGTLEAAPNSMVKGKIGYALSPTALKANTMTIGGWGLAITSSSKHKDEAFKFLTWSTNKNYVKLVGTNVGWARIPSGTRASTYKLSAYLKVAPFAELTLDSLSRAEFRQPAIDPTPYTGNSLPNIPEYPSFGETAGQELAAYISNQKDLDTVVRDIQDSLQKVVTSGGYKK